MGQTGIQEQYRALTEHAATGAVAARRAIRVAGRDRASYLHGLLTNDVQSLKPGEGCYAAWLTPQGRMITDLHVFETGHEILLDVPAEVVSATLERLDQSVFTEDVQLASQTLTPVSVHGPDAPAVIERVIGGLQALASWHEYQHAPADVAGSAIRVARVSQLGVPGFHIYLDGGSDTSLRLAFERAGAVPAQPDAIAAARIEAGYPVFGIDMTEDTIPLEAGIEDRAISFTKGCYVGQEVIIRVLHRGHGRVARKLVALRIEGGVPSAGAQIRAGDRDAGVVTSAARSPRLGPVALGYVHRDFSTSGTQVQIETPAGLLDAIVSDRPMSAGQ